MPLTMASSMGTAIVEPGRSAVRNRTLSPFSESFCLHVLQTRYRLSSMAMKSMSSSLLLFVSFMIIMFYEMRRVRDLLGLACLSPEKQDDLLQHLVCIMLLAHGCLPATKAVLFASKFCPQDLHGLLLSVGTFPVGNDHVVQFANHVRDRIPRGLPPVSLAPA